MSNKERPILFSAPMIRAILAGTKSQTRRVITSHKKAAPYFVIYADRDGGNHRPVYSDDGERGCYTDAQGYDVEEQMHCPYGQPGDRLWVRESFAFTDAHEPNYEGSIEYRADNKVLAVMTQELYDVPHMCADQPFAGPWRPSIHMPRWASRITLEVTGVRVERLQDISDVDAAAEGCSLYDMQHGDRLASVYARLWESINGPRSWDANPWVWVITFRRVHD